MTLFIEQCLNGLQFGLLLFLLAAGLTLVFGIMDLVNLAHGSLYMIGAYFDLHPWHQVVRINVEDRTFPITAHFPPQISLRDEIYQFKDYSRDKVRVLMSIDTSSVDLKAKMVKRTDGDFAMAWVKNYGKGRVFFNALGHDNEVYDRPDIQKMFIEGVKWVMGKTEGDATPRPRK